MNNQIFVGIDTSNYTTSCAISDSNGNVLHNFKLLLPVKDGERGLRQSEAVFAHIKNFQLISEQVKNVIGGQKITAIGYSAFPRDVEGSYMPCFLVGETIAKALSSFNDVKLYRFSHQSGHIRAAVYSSGVQLSDNEEFIAFHVSGGTTEVVNVCQKDNYYKIDIIGGSVDLQAGQAIDRVGVFMGLKFPCGKEMEQYAKENKKEIPNYNISVKDFSCNLSGLENLAINLYKKTEDKALTCAFVFDFVGKVLEKISLNLKNKYPERKIIYGGGVLSNGIIQERLKNKLSNVYFAEPQYSCDNGAGIALLARDKYINE